MKNKLLVILILLFAGSCTQNNDMSNESNPTSEKRLITQASVDAVIHQLNEQFGEAEQFRIDRGVKQVAALWKSGDGSAEDFTAFCTTQFVPSGAKQTDLLNKVAHNMEILNGYFNTMSLALQEPVHLDLGPITPFDQLMGAYSPSAHLTEDLYANKIAFIVALNFPAYTLEEKEAHATDWTSLDWAAARAGDLFTTRVPSGILQNISKSMSDADLYISEYNIMMGYLRDQEGKSLFPEDMKLISHWNLRDELKSNYQNDGGLQKQEMIYQVMLHIIDQSIPEMVINSADYTWNPYTNKVFKDGNEVNASPEPDTRYQKLLNNFLAMHEADPYNPQYPSYIQRAFDAGMELTESEVEKIFVDFVSSPVLNEMGQLISKRLGRDLKPFDIWYDGFKSRSSIDENELNKLVAAKYPNREAFAAGLPDILTKLDFTPEEAAFITSKVQVDPARGAGHAWGAEMKSVKSHLRTRIGANGMNYKGYNIAVHEFGHNVEQTISLHQVDNYLLHGVPNTAFTEALAFIFQKRDLALLGIKEGNPDKQYLDALDITWSTYEIMGVSLVDMGVWKWLYQHPNTTASELKTAVISIAKDIWNKYYAPVFGIEDSPILAIYSHMIDYPLYLSAYPVGHLIDFQIEEYLKGKVFAEEVKRMYKQGRLSPQAWMRNAVGSEISGQPMLNAAAEALKFIKE